MIDLHIATSLAISYGVEDHIGLYELIWGLNTHYPEVDAETKVRAADQAMRSLLSIGHVHLYEGRPHGPAGKAISLAVALWLLDDSAVWKPPLERVGLPVYWFAATEAGGDALERREYESL